MNNGVGGDTLSASLPLSQLTVVQSELHLPFCRLIDM